MKSLFGPESLEATRAELEAMLGGNSACGQVPACALQLKNSIKELDSLLAQYKRQSELTPKVDAALMIFDLATSGVGGVIRGSVFDAVRMSATRAAGGSLEMAAAKIAYADGASWTVRNAEVLAADGKTVLARQNPITGKYDSGGPRLLSDGSKPKSEIYFRVEGGGAGSATSQNRITVNADGTISIKPGCSGQLCVSVGGSGSCRVLSK